MNNADLQHPKIGARRDDFSDVNGLRACTRAGQQIIPFFQRLEGLGFMLFKCTGGGFVSVVELSESKQRIQLDLSAAPVKVRIGGTELDGTMGMRGSENDLEQVLRGTLGVAEGLAKRRLMFKGSMRYLVSMVPVLLQTPVLYADHLYVQTPVGPIRRGLARFLQRIFAFFAMLAGRLLRRADRRQVLSVLGAMSRGVSRFSPGERIEAKPRGKRRPAHPLDAPPAAVLQRATIGTLRVFMGAAGSVLSWLKYELHFPLDLFAILGRFSDGMQE